MQMVSLNRRTAFVLPQKFRKFPVTVQIDRRPDNVIMDVRFINMGTDDKCVFALGKPVGNSTPSQLASLQVDLAGTEGLPDMIGNPHRPFPRTRPVAEMYWRFASKNSASATRLSASIAGNQFSPWSVFCGFAT